MSHTARRFDRSARNIDGVAVTVTELVWPDEFRYFAVFLPDGTELTTNGCFDTLPTDDELNGLLDEHRGQWHCPSCYTTIATSEHDLIADHVRDCYHGSEE